MATRLIDPHETHGLRQSVLRPAQSPKEMEWPLDRAEGSFHVGVEEDGQLVAIASFLRDGNPQLDARAPYRLRGMATAAGHRSKGHGSSLLRFGLEKARQEGGDLIWCNAREKAVGFYARAGFRVEGPAFHIDGIGVHHLMYMPL